MGFSTCQFKFLPEGTIKLWFDSVWMGVTGGAMVGVTLGEDKNTCTGSAEEGIYKR